MLVLCIFTKFLKSFFTVIWRRYASLLRNYGITIRNSFMRSSFKILADLFLFSQTSEHPWCKKTRNLFKRLRSCVFYAWICVEFRPPIWQRASKIEKCPFQKKLVKWNEAISQNFFFLFSENKILISMDFFFKKTNHEIDSVDFHELFFQLWIFSKIFWLPVIYFFLHQITFSFFLFPTFLLVFFNGLKT